MYVQVIRMGIISITYHNVLIKSSRLVHLLCAEGGLRLRTK